MNTNQTWKIKYYDGESATAHLCQAEVRQGQLFIIDSHLQQLDVWDVQNIKYDPNHLDHSFLMVLHEPNARIEMLDRDLENHLPNLKRNLFHSDTDFKKIFISVIIISALIITVVYLSIRPLSKIIAHKIPIEYEAQLSQGMKLGEMFSLCDGSDLFKEIQIKYPDLEKHIGEFKNIKIIQMSQANAFALPGGQIILTDELIYDAESYEEIIGVIAHEKGHVYHRHITQSLIRTGIISGTLFILTGTGDLIQNATILSGLTNLKFDRELEAEADNYALDILKKANITSYGLIQFFQRSHKKVTGQIPEFLSSHPSDNNRIKNLEAQFIAQIPQRIDSELKQLKCVKSDKE